SLDTVPSLLIRSTARSGIDPGRNKYFTDPEIRNPPRLGNGFVAAVDIHLGARSTQWRRVPLSCGPVDSSGVDPAGGGTSRPVRGPGRKPGATPDIMANHVLL